MKKPVKLFQVIGGIYVNISRITIQAGRRDRAIWHFEMASTNNDEEEYMSTQGIGARIDIKLDRCNGCGICVNSCAVDVIRLNEEIKKATAKYPQECMLCGYCELDCPEEAIYLSPVKDMPPVLSWG
jgi:NAD-dependent dihydropyrimidine dehydrogenase PreA subunit